MGLGVYSPWYVNCLCSHSVTIIHYVLESLLSCYILSPMHNGRSAQKHIIKETLLCISCWLPLALVLNLYRCQQPQRRLMPNLSEPRQHFACKAGVSRRAARSSGIKMNFQDDQSHSPCLNKVTLIPLQIQPQLNTHPPFTHICPHLINKESDMTRGITAALFVYASSQRATKPIICACI